MKQTLSTELANLYLYAFLKLPHCGAYFQATTLLIHFKEFFTIIS